ncbi:hypothetical protein ACWGCW_35085 [Streptomyces sp. NPDC054933]
MLLGIRIKNYGTQTAWYEAKVTIKGDNGFNVTHVLNLGTISPGPESAAGTTFYANPDGPRYADHPVVTIDQVWRTLNYPSGVPTPDRKDS